MKEQQLEKLLSLMNKYLVSVDITFEQDHEQVTLTFESVMEHTTVSTTKSIFLPAVDHLPEAAFLHLANGVAQELGRQLYLSYSHKVDSSKIKVRK